MQPFHIVSFEGHTTFKSLKKLYPYFLQFYILYEPLPLYLTEGATHNWFLADIVIVSELLAYHF